jgi:hypothetical protein
MLIGLVVETLLRLLEVLFERVSSLEVWVIELLLERISELSLRQGLNWEILFWLSWLPLSLKLRLPGWILLFGWLRELRLKNGRLPLGRFKDRRCLFLRFLVGSFLVGFYSLKELCECGSVFFLKLGVKSRLLSYLTYIEDYILSNLLDLKDVLNHLFRNIRDTNQLFDELFCERGNQTLELRGHLYDHLSVL